jgi:hypothetical protein
MVAGVYQDHHFNPKRFQWRQRLYSIDTTTFVSDNKDGGVRKRHYSVMSGGNLYRLEFNRDTEQWLLMEVWHE